MDRYVSLYLRWRWNEVFSYSIKPRSIMWRTWTTNLSGGKESSNMRSGCNSLHIFWWKGGKAKKNWADVYEIFEINSEFNSNVQNTDLVGSTIRTLVTLSCGGFKPSCCCCWSSNNFFFLACFNRKATAWTPDAMVPSRFDDSSHKPLNVFWQSEGRAKRTHFSTHQFYTLLYKQSEWRKGSPLITKNTTQSRGLGCGHLVSWIRTAGIDPLLRHRGRECLL